MKIIMKSSDEKGGSTTGNNSGNTKVRIAVIGQHEVGKSALTVRYLTRRYIGEYKSNTDLLYRQTLTVAHGSSLDIEIVDISTKETRGYSENETTFPLEEMQRADAFIIVYSITDRNSFNFALQTMSAIAAYQQAQSHHSCQSHNMTTNSTTSSHQTHQQQSNNHHHTHHPSTATTTPVQSTQPHQSHSPPPLSKHSSIVLLANKNDLEHMRTVEKVEGLSLAMQYGCHFNEISVAENSPELYQSFQTIISNYANQNQTTSKRKFSVSKMLGNLRIGRTSPCQQVLSQASIIDTSMSSDLDSNSSGGGGLSGDSRSPSASPPDKQSTLANGPGHTSCSGGKVCGGSGHVRNSSDTTTAPSSTHHNHISSSICHIKSKIVEFHSLKKRHNSPPICSL